MILLRLLPARYRNLVELGQRIFANLDTARERKEVLDYFKQALQDGQISVNEWAKIGKKLHIYKKRENK
jgi:hypothetical protein